MPRSKGTFTQHWDIQGTKDKPVRLQLAGEVSRCISFSEAKFKECLMNGYLINLMSAYRYVVHVCVWNKLTLI